MCKAYDGEPNLDLLRAFLNLGPASDWLTLSNRGGSGIPKALTKPVTHIKGWRGSFFFIKNKMVPSKYPKLLLKENTLGKKSFKDVVPLYVREDPLYYQIDTYPCNVRTFPDPILFLAGLKSFWKHSPKKPIIYHYGNEIDFRSFMMGGIDAPVIDVDPLNSAPPSHVVEKVRDSDDISSKGDIVGEAERLHKSLKVTVVGDASDPLDVESGPDIHEFPSAKELKDSADRHFVVAHVTPPSRKHHLRDISHEKLCNIHDRAYMRQDKAYAELERKCNKALQDLDKNPLVSDMRINYEQTLSILRAKVEGLELEKERLKNSKTQLMQDIDSLKQDRATMVSKVVPNVDTKPIRSDEMGFLVAKLVKAAMFRGRCATFKEVASLKGLFILEKMPGYRSSSKKEFDRAGDGLANASYPFLAEITADPHAP
ncbi:hypothetical protein Tco_1477193 [Tanacetum coccineum]